MSELRDAYFQFKRVKDSDKMLMCLEILWKEERDYSLVRDFRDYLLLQKPDEHNLKLARRSYMMCGKEVFDDFIIGMEWERPYKSKFYIPRREQLKPIVMEMQKLEDGEYDILCLSAPPGIGKTGLGDFFMCWVAGRHPDLSMLMGSHSLSILNDNYGECLRMCTSEEYCWEEIFEGHSVVRTNAADLKIDIDTAKKFSTFSFGSLGGSLAGKVRAMSLLYLDDVIANSEIALNRERLDKVYQQVTTDYFQRMQGADCKLLCIMTRWANGDPIGRLIEEHDGDPRFKWINLPAMDEEDHSNFDYGGNIGFTTKFYRNLRESMDSYMWDALYMGKPIDREGALFDKNELLYYTELPGEDPDAIIAVVDTKDRGTDDCVMPIAYKYGDKYYIEVLMCDSSTPEVTVPRIVDELCKHGVDQCRFESNAAGGQIAKDVERRVRDRGGKCHISTKYTTANKETRIIVNSYWVKEHCLFRDNRNNEYEKALKLLCGFSSVSKKKKDDVPDALSMLADFANSFETNVITIRQRIF